MTRRNSQHQIDGPRGSLLLMELDPAANQQKEDKHRKRVKKDVPFTTYCVDDPSTVPTSNPMAIGKSMCGVRVLIEASAP